MRKVLLIYFPVWLSMTCSPRMSTHTIEPPMSGQGQPVVSRKPDWVIRKPTQNGYYVGLGSAKTSQVDYHRVAKDKALEDMVTEISVTVDATSFLYQAEFGRQFTERYEAFIKTNSLEELSEFELLDDWTDGKEYWVAYGLSKSRYRELKDRKLQAAKTIALEHLKNAGFNEQHGKFLTAIHSYLKTIDALKHYLNEPVRAKIGENEQPVVLYCINAIQGILNDLEIGEKQIDISAAKRIPGKITLLCRGSIAEGFLLTGIDRQFTTNQNGQILIGMDVVTGRAVVTLALSREMLRTFGRDHVIVDEIVDSFNLPVFDVRVSILPVTLHIRREPLIQEAGEPRSSIKPALVNFLSTHGFIFDEKPENSDFRLTYKVTTRHGPETNGLFVCWANLEIRFFNADNDLIYSDQLLGVKGIHSSYAAAEVKAVENITLLLEEKIIQPFIKHVF
ncbi:MAG: LPP20 family lipoprotein [Cytophagales bacterium]|nr:LPP20 family lipoprotein [Cytophagales bacterium]